MKILQLLLDGEEMQPSASDGNFYWTETDPMLAMGASARLKLIILFA
jgi:hypothetical protein